MYRFCKTAVPVGRHVVRRNFWSFPRPTDFRLMLRDVDRQMDQLEREFQNFFTRSPLASLVPRSLPVVETCDNTYRINVDLSGFKPEDIKLNLKDRLLTIDAKMERKSDDGSRLYQEVSRVYTLPETVEVKDLKSLLTSDGILSIEAPITPTEGAQKPQEIPIGRTEEISAK